MEKSFEKFCARVKREREGVPARSKYADWIVAECIRWTSALSASEVAEGLGISKESVNQWKRLGESVVSPPSVDEKAEMPAVLNVTRISVAGAPAERRVLARLVRGEVAIEFFDESAIARALEGVIA